MGLLSKSALCRLRVTLCLRPGCWQLTLSRH